MTGIRKKNKILGFIFAVLAVWMVIFQIPSYAAQRGSLNVKTEQAGMTVYLYRVAEKQAGVYVMNENFQASGADVSGGGSSAVWDHDRRECFHHACSNYVFDRHGSQDHRTDL